MLKLTSFLPDVSLPKQRVWHIINNTYERPLCPTTGKYVSWFENRYLTYFNHAARDEDAIANKMLKTTLAKGEEWNKDRALRAGNTIKRRFAEGSLSMIDRTISKGPEHAKITADAVEAKYGVRNVMHHPEVIETYRHAVGFYEASEREKYYREVKEHTKQSWVNHFDQINPECLKRGSEMHLDHIFSQVAGFKNNIPPEVIGHHTNLRMLSREDNGQKSGRCDKSIEQLYEDFRGE